MADVENPAGPKKDHDELVVAERSEFIWFACMWTLLSLGIALLIISVGLMLFFEINYPGTKLDAVVFVSGSIGIIVAWTCIFVFKGMVC